MADSHNCDVAIIGSGLVGSALACALGESGLEVALIEAQAPRNAGAPDAHMLDRRNLALARRSVETLERLGIWADIARQAAAISEVHVSRRGDFGKLRLDSGALHLDAFGCTVPAPVLGDALESRLRTCRGLERLQPARLHGWRREGSGLLLEVGGQQGLELVAARLLVAADGTDSDTRERAGIGVTRRDYGQTAIVGSVALDREHGGRAFERFLDDGLVALLPLAGRACGFVWAMPSDAASEAMRWNDATFTAGLQSVFGHRLGVFRRIGKRQSWPLRGITAHALCADRLVLVGNAAQTVHPVGAQGFNLGLRDAVALAEEIIAARTQGRDIGGEETLHRYATRRQADRDATVATSNALIAMFGSSNAAIRFATSAGLALLERLPVVKRGLARSGMGYRPEGTP